MAFGGSGHGGINASINITPLVDVVLVLLLIFMLTAPVLQSGIEVAVPALIGYNQLTARIREFAARMDDFGRELLNAIENAALVAPPPPPDEPRRRSF